MYMERLTNFPIETLRGIYYGAMPLRYHTFVKDVALLQSQKPVVNRIWMSILRGGGSK
jgi:hypothetical protein